LRKISIKHLIGPILTKKCITFLPSLKQHMNSALMSHRRVENTVIWISWGILFYIQNEFRVWIKGLSGCFWWWKLKFTFKSK
jgi:hypothetical protein